MRLAMSAGGAPFKPEIRIFRYGPFLREVAAPGCTYPRNKAYRPVSFSEVRLTFSV